MKSSGRSAIAKNQNAQTKMPWKSLLKEACGTKNYAHICYGTSPFAR
jgi:hypothetical protein